MGGERRHLVATVVVVLLIAVLTGGGARIQRLTLGDGGVLVGIDFLLAYLAVTLATFTRATPAQVRAWADRDERGSCAQRYILGTAPGPGTALWIAFAALVATVIWPPAADSSALAYPTRWSLACLLVAAAWTTLVVTFNAVTSATPVGALGAL